MDKLEDWIDGALAMGVLLSLAFIIASLVYVVDYTVNLLQL